ncbi:hypothetical protein B5807_02182 [Epicoccum nigrum]|uniref:LisH domain-containing protein n=1 Tax=Epicoccum nigrum TaxID=105696 RepID=A0A1Y2MAE4_EPING|nr:hypothetical protein B5807_02182 [Epicoccum nigrum]
MQNQQMQMAMNGGPVNGTPVMANMNMPGPPQRQPMDPREQLNTYIYDYFLRNNHGRLARAMIDCEMKMSTTPPTKTSPGNKQNGMDHMDDDSITGLPNPLLPEKQMADNSFLLDWWVQFWDIFQASKGRGQTNTKGGQYIQHTRHITQMQNEQRNQRMMMSNPMNAQYQNVNMMRANMPNGVPNDLKRAALQNNRPNGNPMANMGPMNKSNMMGQQMQRDGSQMDLNGQRPQSPNLNENAPSPNKRPRVEGAMGNNMPNAQFNEFGQPANNAPQQKLEAMTQGSPMNQGLDGQEIMFAGNQSRPGMPPQQPGQPQQGSHALQDYQMQLMLLEQQNKKRLLMARQEQDNISGPHQQGQGQFPPAMSPSGTRAGPSPNPADMKGRTPKLGQQGLPGSPMPEGVMQQQRASPAPNMNFPDPNLAPPGMPPQFYPQMPNNPMMRPPSSHPGANFNGQQQMTPQQVEAIRNGQMNGQWRGGPPQPGMPQQPQMMGGPMAGGPQQRNQMPPPPAPTNEQRPEASPAMSNQAPPTPNQGNKAGPKKKGTKDNKKPAPKKGPNAGTTPAASAGEEAPTPTPSTPITPMHAKSFNPNGQPQQAPQQPPQPQAPGQQPMGNDAPFGDLTESSFDIGLNFGDGDAALENFDFDSFLHTGEDSGGFGGLVGFDDFTNGVEAGDGM